MEAVVSKTASAAEPEEVRVDRVVPGITVIMVTQLSLPLLALTSSYSDIIFIWSAAKHEMEMILAL